MHDRAAVQVQHDRHIAVPFPDRDFVNRNLREVFEPGLCEVPAQMPLLDVPHQPLADAQMRRHVLDRHAAPQFEDVEAEAPRVLLVGFGEGDGGLPRDAAVPTVESGDVHPQVDGTRADENGLPLAAPAAASLDVGRPAGGAAEVGAWLSDGHDQAAGFEGLGAVTVAPESEGAVQECGGHAALGILRSLPQPQMRPACPRFLQLT